MKEVAILTDWRRPWHSNGVVEHTAGVNQSHNGTGVQDPCDLALNLTQRNAGVACTCKSRTRRQGESVKGARVSLLKMHGCSQPTLSSLEVTSACPYCALAARLFLVWWGSAGSLVAGDRVPQRCTVDAAWFCGKWLDVKSSLVVAKPNSHTQKVLLGARRGRWPWLPRRRRCLRPLHLWPWQF
jgi:hypothetical protein